MLRLGFATLLALCTSGCMLLQPPPAQSGSTPSAAGADPSSAAGTSDPSSSGGSSSTGGGSSSGGASSAPEAPSKPAEAPIVSVSVDFRNECSDKVEYCVDSGGSTLNTSLGSNSSYSTILRPGTKIQLKKDNRCGATMFTVPGSRDRQKVVLCQR